MHVVIIGLPLFNHFQKMWNKKKKMKRLTLGSVLRIGSTKACSTMMNLNQWRCFSTQQSFLLDPVRIVVSSSNNAFFNLATEDYLFVDEKSKDFQTLFLWRNDKTVVIGKHQNPFKECNISRLVDDSVTLVRRRSGGGAVYQDLGNSIFTFISPKEEYSKERNFEILKNALRSGFGINSELSGRNDLILAECKRKISGSAFKQGKDVCFHHGTMLVDLDVNALQNYLTPHKLKLLSKGVASVASRVCNLKTISSEINHDSLNETIISEFCKMYDCDRNTVTIEHVNETYFKDNSEWVNFYNQLSDKEWNYGMTPDFTNNIETRFDWGMVDLHIDYKNGKIAKVKMFSDTLFPVLVEAIEEGLTNQDFSREGIKTFEQWLTETKIPSIPNLDDASKTILKDHTKQLCAWMSVALFE